MCEGFSHSAEKGFPTVPFVSVLHDDLGIMHAQGYKTPFSVLQKELMEVVEQYCCLASL